jgi:hypothetical protein
VAHLGELHLTQAEELAALPDLHRDAAEFNLRVSVLLRRNGRSIHEYGS